VSQGILYISYDGMLEPLGQSQVLAYLREISDSFDIHLVSFEKPRDLADAVQCGRLQKGLSEGGIAWHPLRYHKWPPVLSTLWDMLAGMLTCWSISRRHEIRIFHGRNILCAAMLYPSVKLSRGRFVVDIRGFWADERVDGGIIPANGLVYRALKRLERKMLRSADRIVTLTEVSVPLLQNDPAFGLPDAPVIVIPTCADLTLFKPARSKIPPDALTLGYVGKLGTWYLFDQTVQLFRELLRTRPNSRLLVVNQHEHQEVKSAVARAGLPADSVEVVAAAREEVPGYIRRMSAGTSLILPAFSKISSCPTKLAEYLGCGVPCIANRGVGDVAQILTQHRVGVALADTSIEGLAAGIEQLLELLDDPDLSARCRRVAEQLFSLDVGVARYRNIYLGLSDPSGEPQESHAA
jgi:glycosyltransferase involved in cell wall biosynthesis